MLRDPKDDDVVPIVEELRRRLPKVTASGHVQGEEDKCAQDSEGGEENGALCENIDLELKYFNFIDILSNSVNC